MMGRSVMAGSPHGTGGAACGILCPALECGVTGLARLAVGAGGSHSKDKSEAWGLGYWALHPALRPLRLGR